MILQDSSVTPNLSITITFRRDILFPTDSTSLVPGVYLVTISPSEGGEW